MNIRLRIRLQTTPLQSRQLQALQRVFATACNALAIQARSSGIWSRVALHQLAYHPMRAQFPELGSQMLCNVIYSVSRACKLVYQNPHSPFGLRVRGPQNLPLLQFSDDAPVYFDRHTLNVRDGHASMYSLDGRLRFNLPLAPDDEHRLRHGGIREITLTRDEAGMMLNFLFAHVDAEADTLASAPASQRRHAGVEPPDSAAGRKNSLPRYLSVFDGSNQAPGQHTLSREQTQ
jgi:hypothetical protein